MTVELETYNNAWPDVFNIEKEMLHTAIGQNNLVIEHIGSTAIPGLSAKPIIDIMVGLQDYVIAGDLVQGMSHLGYKYMAKYEDAIPDRKFFLKSSGGERSHHVHMVQLNEEYWDRHMFFRNHLRGNEITRNAYQDLKTRLSNLDWKDRNQYALGKAAFIKAVEEKHF
jgi:GrpB-like predicted nucleotidyltransferase (UPF0157 family)